MNKFLIISNIIIESVIKESQNPDSKVSVNLYGLADRKGFTEQDADPNELMMGVKVEMEHTVDPVIAKKITLDHLAEIPDYYTRLSKLEKEAKQTGDVT